MMAHTTTLRLLADDLTGALDTAAEFVPLTGPVHAFWAGATPPALPASAAVDTGTRELGEPAARSAVMAASPLLEGADVAFKKIDSLLRGHTLPELATCMAAGGWTRAVLAPAFPFQGRITSGGQQLAAEGGFWVAAGPNLLTALRAMGLPAQPGEPGAALRPGVTVFDAATEAELAAIATGLREAGPVLWCGTGGLAQALAAGRPRPEPAALPLPVLGLFGSDQDVTAAQLAACAPHWTALPHGGPDSADRLAAGLARDGVALASLDLPAGLSRAEAAARIGRELHALTRRLPRPGTLVAAGGETLRGLCIALGAQSLLVRGRAVPGVPVSTMLGGDWDGVTVLSKSGAFGHPALWRELLPWPARASDLERTLP